MWCDMGSENLHHKRKAKAANKLKRNKAKRSSYQKVLIVCEGEKTEPNYFNDLIDFYKLNTANVKTDGSCGSSPCSVFARAIELWNKENKKGDPYDKVYCVFDKDTHATYHSTITKIKAHKPNNIFYVTQSIPCFEYWLLLHYKHSTKPYNSLPDSSCADQVLIELKKSFPEYKKGNTNVFSTLFDKLEFAKVNASAALTAAEASNTDNPSTFIHKLIEYLQNLKNTENH